MSEYKYKGKFLTLAEMYLNTGNYEPNIEIYEVYRKAGAFDEILDSASHYKISENGHGYSTVSLENLGRDVKGIIGKYKQESGENRNEHHQNQKTTPRCNHTDEGAPDG